MLSSYIKEFLFNFAYFAFIYHSVCSSFVYLFASLIITNFICSPFILFVCLDLSLFVNLSAPMDSISLLVIISICCREVLSIENKHLNPENEMKRIFGSRVVQTENRNIVSFLSIRDFLFGSGWISHNFPPSFPYSPNFTLFLFFLQIRGRGGQWELPSLFCCKWGRCKHTCIERSCFSFLFPPP